METKGSIILYCSTTHQHPGGMEVFDNVGNEICIRAVFTESDILEALDEAEPLEGETVLNTIPVE